MRIAWLVPLLPLVACAAAGPSRALQAPAPVFDPVAFFAGRTRGEGRLTILTRRPMPVIVRGTGTVQSDGSVRLVQQVRQGDQPETTREWRIAPVGGGRYAGTLTDAVGTVRGDTVGNRLHLHFRMRHGLVVDQWLYLQPGGQRTDNRMVVRKLGVPVARLRETITRVP